MATEEDEEDEADEADEADDEVKEVDEVKELARPPTVYKQRSIRDRKWYVSMPFNFPSKVKPACSDFFMLCVSTHASFHEHPPPLLRQASKQGPSLFCF